MRGCFPLPISVSVPFSSTPASMSRSRSRADLVPSGLDAPCIAPPALAHLPAMLFDKMRLEV
jgi:hypothetical protein